MSGKAARRERKRYEAVQRRQRNEAAAGRAKRDGTTVPGYGRVFGEVADRLIVDDPYDVDLTSSPLPTPQWWNGPRQATKTIPFPSPPFGIGRMIDHRAEAVAVVRALVDLGALEVIAAESARLRALPRPVGDDEIADAHERAVREQIEALDRDIARVERVAKSLDVCDRCGRRRATRNDLNVINIDSPWLVRTGSFINGAHGADQRSDAELATTATCVRLRVVTQINDEPFLSECGGSLVPPQVRP